MDSPKQTFVLTTVWHTVEAGPLDGPRVGSFYLFKCFRWARSDRGQGIIRGVLPVDHEPCVRCSAIGAEGQAKPPAPGESDS
jgi:hypothetical protein